MSMSFASHGRGEGAVDGGSEDSKMRRCVVRSTVLAWLCLVDVVADVVGVFVSNSVAASRAQHLQGPCRIVWQRRQKKQVSAGSAQPPTAVQTVDSFPSPSPTGCQRKEFRQTQKETVVYLHMRTWAPWKRKENTIHCRLWLHVVLSAPLRKSEPLWRRWGPTRLDGSRRAIRSNAVDCESTIFDRLHGGAPRCPKTLGCRGAGGSSLVSASRHHSPVLRRPLVLSCPAASTAWGALCCLSLLAFSVLQKSLEPDYAHLSLELLTAFWHSTRNLSVA